MPNSERVWSRIKNHQGAIFETKTGKDFTFEISGNVFNPAPPQNSWVAEA